MELENAGAAAPVADTALPPPVVEETPAAVENKEADLDETLSAIWQKNNRERESNGQFKGKEQPLTQDTVSKDQPPIAATETATPSIPVPQSWSADVKDKWSTLPPDLQAFIAKREGEAHSTITKYGEQVKQFEPIGRVIEHYRESFGRTGVTPEEGLDRLLAANDYLDRDPHSAIMWLANAYGVDLASLAPPQDGSTPEGMLHQTIAELRSELNELKSGLTSERQSKLTAEMKSLESQIDEFSKDKTDWAALEDEILSQVVALKHTSPNSPPLEIVQKAYDRARWANPDARNRILEEQRKVDEKKNLEEAKKRADAAKAASAVNVRSETATGTARGSIDDTLKTAFRQAQSR
jgi:hypothetical protein